MALWKSGVRVPSGPLTSLHDLSDSGKGAAVAKHKRNVWEELLELGRRIVKEVDDLFDMGARQPRKPARVPVPARQRRERQRDK